MLLTNSERYKPTMESSPFVWDASAVAAGLAEIGRSRRALLAHLKYLLDEFHGVERSIEYYDLVAGDWLEGFSHNIYTAWQEVLAGNVPAEISSIPVITNHIHAITLASKVAWHQHLRWSVAKAWEGQSSTNWAVEQESVSIKSGGRNGMSHKLLRGISTSKPKVILTQTNYKCSQQEWAKALWHWRKWISLDNMQYPIFYTANADWEWRKRRSTETSLPPRNFSELVMALMPLYIPITLLEGFEDYRSAVLALSLPRPQVLYSANALSGNLTFKLLIAEWRQEGTQLLYHQHGGGYGLEAQMAVEDYEISVSDRFYSWGWTREGAPVYPLSPAMPVARRKCQGKYILLNCLDLPTVPYRLMFTPMPGTIETMHRNTCEFLMGIPDRQNLIIRPYPHDYGWGALDAMRSIAPEATFATRSNIFSLFSACRLAVHSYLGTSWLETIGLNIPTVCFYDPATYIYREEVQPFIVALQKVGILHHSGKDAARFIIGLGNNIEGWWKKYEVQEARRNFVERYANFSKNWKEQWELEFESALAA